MRTYKIRLVINRPQDVERRSINNVATIALASFMIYIFKFHFVTSHHFIGNIFTELPIISMSN